jgi:hypothetical protein
MTANDPHPDDEMGRILPFQRKARASKPREAPVEGLGKYTKSGEPDDYRQRMINNGLALVAILVLGGIGVWLANSIADLRKNQDCVLSGRRDCAPMVAPQQR